MAKSPPRELKTFLGAYDPGVRKLFLETRAAVIHLAPLAHETVWDAVSAVATSFSFTPKWNQGFIHIAAYRTHVNLGFNHGAALPDSKKVLQGTGNKIRHIKIAAARDLKRPEVKALVGAAIAHITKMGFGAVPGSKPTVVIRSMSGPRRRPPKVKTAKPRTRARKPK